jgi:hypothetical protein
MEKTSLKDIIDYFHKNKIVLYERFGVTRIGIFGSFARGEQSLSSDIDLIVDMEGKKKDIHNFLQLKRFLEKETKRKIDLGFEHSLKPIVKEKIGKHIIYV